jgi:DNA transposition AAA+ family ATPase
MELHARFLSLLEEADMSQNQVASQIGISASLVSAYKNGTYDNNIPEIEKKIRLWIEKKNVQEESLTIPYSEVEATRLIMQTINTAKRDRDFAVIVGKAGCSKSETIKRYCRENKGSILIKINKSATGILLRSIAQSIGIECKGGNTSLYEKIISFLRGKNIVMIVDEADYLKENCLQLLRHISDDAGIGIVLVGLLRLEFNILSQNEDYQQLARRIGTFLNLNVDGKYCQADAEKIVRSVWKEAEHEIVTEFYKQSKSCLGTLTKLMEKANYISAKNNRMIPSMDDIRESAKVVFRCSNAGAR